MKPALPPLPAPLVGPHHTLVEITVKGLLLGSILSVLLAAANAYIGLLVGMTVSASIPAAAVSMGVLRLFPRSNILENNMVQTASSAGQALVAGMIFTVPALVMMKAWPGYQYWPMVCMAVIGGVLGVAFTIPLRRALIVEARLTFPEGVATAEVLKTGGIETEARHTTNSAESTRGLRHLLEAAGLGALFKLLQSGAGILAGTVSTVQSTFGGHYLFSANITMSSALLGVGYIVGLNIAVLVFLGGIIGTLAGVPLNWWLNSEAIMAAAGVAANTPWSELSAADWANLASQSWSSCRRIGVGAMMVGGVWSLLSLLKPLIKGVRASLQAHREREQRGLARTEQDTPIQVVIVVALLSALPLFLIFHSALAQYADRLVIAVLMTVLMLVFGFVFASVAGYMAGLVGSSNNPISGVTIATVITSALILLQLMGNEGPAAILGPMAVMYLAAMICSAAAIAGDNMQDLKCGHLLGATPWRQQLYQVIGVVAAALVIPIVLQVLDAGYGIGRPAPGSIATTFLSAPQASLMAALSSGIFGAGIEWNFIFIGCALAVVLIVLDQIQRRRGASFRVPVLAVAVGIYLPLGLSVPIFVGGLIATRIARLSRHADPASRQRRSNAGLLVASGLITGEALMGVLLAVVAAFVMPLPGTVAAGGALGIAAMVLVIGYLYRRTLKG